MAVVLDALASYLQNMLTEVAKEEVHMLLGVSGEIDKMGIKLGDLKNFLADADKRNITDHSVQAWVKQLRDTMYDATDILDLCQLKAMERGPSQDVGCFNPLLLCMRNPLHAHDIGSRIKNLNQRLDGIKARSAAFNFINLSSYEDRTRKMPSSHSTSRETSGELDESSVVGEKIKEDTRNMVEMLTKGDEISGQDNKIMVFAIVGVGGIGKTTHAQKIFNDDIIQQEFTKKVWLSVNQEFDENKLLTRAIIESGGGSKPVDYPKSALERILKETLKGHKTLLVMDDVWDHRAWEDVLKTPLVNALARGSRVLITTRHDTVARGMKAVEPYHHVDKLEPKDAWSLLKMQVVKNKNDKPDIDMLKDIGMRIIAKCDCLPLAAKVMGGLLCQKKLTRRDWEKVEKDSIWSVSKMPEQLNNAIYLSYEDLHPSLKQCFLHYSLIPRCKLLFDHTIVSMWISEGFVHGNTEELEDLGREYYDELISRNLIDPGNQYFDQSCCNMHDVVRSFAQYVARDEALVSHLGEINISSKLNSQKFLRLSYQRSETNELEWSSLQAQKSLRTIISFGHLKIKPGDSFVSFSSLRTLYLSFANCDALLESLFQLKHLRYLCITVCGISILPENIGMMKLLLHIDISGNESLVKLPGSIVKLRQLRTLNLCGTGINKIPKGFKVLDNLRHLAGFPAHMDGEWCTLEELGPLSLLGVLAIISLENVSTSSFAKKARLSEKVRLRLLQLCCTSRLLEDDSRLVKEEEGVSEEEQQRIEEVFDELCPPPCLERLEIEGYYGRRLPRWMMSTTVTPFESLRIVTMQDLACCTELPDGLCQLPCLELLQIYHAPAIKRVGPGFLQHYHHRHNHSQVAPVFPRLRVLNLTAMLEWEEWEWEEQVQAMPVLEKLQLETCELRHIPPGLAFHARALRRLNIYYVEQLSSLENFASVVLLEVFGNTDLERISNLPKLQKLVIVVCPKMKVLEGVPALQTLNLDDYKMETLPRYLQNAKPGHLQLYCSLRLLKSIATGESSLEWNKFSHIQQVKAYAAEDGGIPRKRCVLYTREPFSFETNISRSAITQARWERKKFAYLTTCPIKEQLTSADANAVERRGLRIYFRRWREGVELAYYNPDA